MKWEELSGIVLCGHSYGGMVVTGVADAVPEAISSLVYLDAFVPENGKSLWDFVPEQFRQGFLDGAGAHGGYAMPPIPAAMFNVNSADAAWVDRMCVPMPFAAFKQNITLTGAHEQVPKRTYIYAANWQPSPFTQFDERLKSDPAWTVKVAACGHHIMLDMPDALAQMLAQAA